MRILFFTFFSTLLLTGCLPSLPKKEKVSQEAIYRKKEEHHLFITPVQLKSPPTYPWEKKYLGTHPLITKEFFQCRGCSENAPYPKGGRGEILHDCDGSHGLPLHGTTEFIYPTLVTLLNYIQEETGKRVVITTGHRCPLHNRYADPSSYNWDSKHMLGAEVDFYVEGLEESPQLLLTLIQKYYQSTPPFQSDPNYTTFLRYERGGLNVTTPPWYNKEIFIKLYKSDEGRDLDNQHPYPYLSIQMRFDKAQNARVRFDEAQAKHYLRA